MLLTEIMMCLNARSWINNSLLLVITHQQVPDIARYTVECISFVNIHYVLQAIVFFNNLVIYLLTAIDEVVGSLQHCCPAVISFIVAKEYIVNAVKNIL